MTDKSDAARARAAYRSYIEREWAGDEALALAYMVNALAEAFGEERGDWGRLTEAEQRYVIQYFSALHPPRDGIEAAASNYRMNIGLRLPEFVANLAAVYEHGGTLA